MLRSYASIFSLLLIYQWSFQHNDINTTKLQNVKEAVDLRGHPLTPSELTLFPGSIVELRKVWIKLQILLLNF